MATIRDGAKQAVVNCVKLKPGERVVIIGDVSTRAIAEALYSEAEAISPLNIRMFTLEDFGERSTDGSNPLQFPDEIRDAMAKANVSFFAASPRKGELQSFRMPMLSVITEHKETLRHAHMIGITEEVMKGGMAVDYLEVQRITRKVHKLAEKAKAMRVTTPAGTDLQFTFSDNHKWVVCDGAIDVPGKWTNLPDGETFTTPQSVNGTMVVDGVLGDYFDRKYGLLDANPVTIKVRDSRIQSLECANKDLKQELETYFAMDEHANRIGEVAIGTNTFLKELVGNLLQDEKFPGNHNAFGDPYPKLTGANWESKAHIDGVMRDCSIWLDGALLMKNGVFVDSILR